MGNLNFSTTPTYDSVLSCGLRFRTCLKLTATRISPDFLRACVRTSRVTIARVSLHSCYIARLIHTSVCRADTGWMTKSRTVDPKSRFSLSTTRACCTRTWSVAAPAPIPYLPSPTQKPFPIARVRVPTPLWESTLVIEECFYETSMIILNKKNHATCFFVQTYYIYIYNNTWMEEKLLYNCKREKERERKIMIY